MNKPYTVRSIGEMLGLSRGVVMGLVAAGFVTPTRGPRNEYRFDFRDVVLLRTAAELKAARVPARRIVAALRKLRAGLPREVPLSGLRISAVGDSVTVREGGARWQVDSGQQVMDFDVVPANSGDGVAFLRGGERPAPPAATRVDDAGSWLARAEALESSDASKAESAYRRALELDPERADAWLNLGALLCDRGRFADALVVFDAALARFPIEPLLHFNRAVALEDLSRFDDALASYGAALRLDPSLADAHYNAARIHEQLGDARSAVRHLSAYRRLQR